MNGIELTIVGNLSRDPELRYTTSGRAVASAGCAVSRRYKQDDEWKEVTSWVNLTLWGDLGEHAAASLHKGDRVIAQGRFEQREYETEEGEKRQTWEMTVDAIGPELRWANVTVNRIQRTGRDDAPHPADTAEPHSSPGTSGGRSAPLPEEEPFVMPATERDV